MPDIATPTEYPVSTGLKTSDEIGELAKALAAARKDFKPVLKDANNPFFKSKYADLAGVIEATSDALSKQGLVVIQSPRLGLNRIAVTTLLAHSSGQWLRDDLELPLSKFDAQGAGSAITYARRYAYQAIVGVAAEDDDGNAASQKFEKSGDSFVRKADNAVNVPSLPQPPVIGKLPETKKPVGRPKKESVPDAGKPWAGLAGQRPAETAGQLIAAEEEATKPVTNIHGVDIKDSEIEFPGDPKPEENRLPTETEAKDIRARLIAVKEKGYSGLGQWILKVSGKPRTNDIPYSEAIKLVEQVEVAEKAGTLATLLK